MLEKVGIFVAKKALFTTMNVILPGSGSLLSRADRLLNVANKLGPRATIENVETIVDLMDGAGEAAKNVAGNILDSLF